MPLIDVILLLTFVTINIIYNEWMGWERLGIPKTNDQALAILITVTIGYVLVKTLGMFVKNRILSFVKFVLFISVLLTMVCFPLLNNINIRRTSVNYLFIHDGALQTEIAARYLYKFKNPYATTYFGTPLESWPYGELEFPTAKNPALYHFAYLPFYLITSAAGQLVQKFTLGWEDVRFTLLVQYAGMVAIVWLLTKKMKERDLYLVLFAVNPVVIHFLLEGRNDTASFFYLIASAFFLSKNKLTTSAVFLAFAASFKQTIWLAVPFFLCYVFFDKQTKQKAKSYALVFLTVTALFILPFFLWDPKSFLDSTINYVSGTAVHSYPIKTLGLGQLLLSTHVIKDTHAYFPFWIFQLVFVVPLLLFFLKKLRESPKLSYVFLFFSVTSLVFLYFSRMFSESYLTIVYLSFTAAMLFYQKENKKI